MIFKYLDHNPLKLGPFRDSSLLNHKEIHYETSSFRI